MRTRTVELARLVRQAARRYLRERLKGRSNHLGTGRKHLPDFNWLMVCAGLQTPPWPGPQVSR